MRVAVVGTGPGSGRAEQLNQAGHLVTVYERDDRVADTRSTASLT